jgi:hypothetical protein
MQHCLVVVDMQSSFQKIVMGAMWVSNIGHFQKLGFNKDSVIVCGFSHSFCPKKVLARVFEIQSLTRKTDKYF